jgi:hypothetical protein
MYRHPRRRFTGAKIQIYFGLSKKNVLLRAFFRVYKEEAGMHCNNASKVHSVKYFRRGVNLFRKAILRKVLF